MEKLTALKGYRQLLYKEEIAYHVGVAGVPLAGPLLYHQVRVIVAQDVSDAEFLGKLEAMHKGFIFGNVVGGGEVDLERVAEPVALRG